MAENLPQFSAGLSRSFLLDGSLKIAATIPFGFDIYWLHEITAGASPGILGLRVDSGASAALQLSLGGPFPACSFGDAPGWLRLRVFRRNSSAPGFASNLLVTAQRRSLLPGPPEQLALAILGGVISDTEPGRALRRFPSVLDLARSIHALAPAAIEKKFSAELSYCYAMAAAADPLLDCSFDLSVEGLSAYRSASAGDFSFLGAPSSPHIRLHRAPLTDFLSRPVHLELHLPFLRRKQWRHRAEALAGVEIETAADGGLFVFLPDDSARGHRMSQYQSRLLLADWLHPGKDARFTLSYSDQRRLSPAQARFTLAPLLISHAFEEGQISSSEASLLASLTLSIPGSLGAAWLRAPRERDPGFFAVYSAVSVAVQRVLRQWIPYLYFSDLQNYDDLGAAFPLLVYQSLRPFPGQPRCEFTYDVLSPNSTLLEGRFPARALAPVLRRVSQLLIGSGRTSTARSFAPDQARLILASVRSRPRLLNSLLAADAFLVDSLVALGVRGHEFSAALSREPGQAIRDLAHFSARFVTTFHRRLRRLYRGRDFSPLGSLLLVEATRALGVALDGRASASGVLHLTLGPDHKIFVRPPYSPPPFSPIHPLR